MKKDLVIAKKTKIVATIGPATENEETMTALVLAGMNVVRCNFSHGTHAEHRERVRLARVVSQKLKVPVGVLQDLSGPKIRLGELTPQRPKLVAGNKFVLTSDACVGNELRAHCNYAALPREIKVGGIIFLNDGKVKLEVTGVHGNDITCTVLIGGEIKTRAGVNAPAAYLKISSLTPKDKEDIAFGIAQDVDYMAISFVRTAEDVKELRSILAKANADVQIIAKVETQEAIDNIDEIISVADGIMVARGDLAIEVPAEDVPLLQKRIVGLCNKAGKPVIVATQMLESMIHSPVPTRAEVNDVANAILDGTDAIMLSEETTLGKHPEAAVEVMARVAMRTEQNLPYEEILRKNHLAFKDTTGSVTYAVVNTAHDLEAKAIVALSISGFTARMMSRYKPARPVLVITPNHKTYNRLALSFNCYPILMETIDKLELTVSEAKKAAIEMCMAQSGDTLLIVAGIPFRQAGSTNMLLVEKV